MEPQPRRPQRSRMLLRASRLRSLEYRMRFDFPYCPPVSSGGVTKFHPCSIVCSIPPRTGRALLTHPTRNQTP